MPEKPPGACGASPHHSSYEYLANVSSLSVSLGFLPEEFFGCGGLFFRRFGVLVIGGGPECGEGTAAGNVAKSGYAERAEFFEGLGRSRCQRRRATEGEWPRAGPRCAEPG